MISSLYRMNFQSQVLRSIFVSERVITVSKPKDQKSFNQSRRTKKSFNRIRKELKGKIQPSTENQQDLEKPNRKSPDQIEKPLRPTKEIEPRSAML